MKEVFKNEQLFEEFKLIFFDDLFIEICIEKTKKKFIRPLNRLSLNLKNMDLSKFEEHLNQTFNESKICKLPWTPNEIKIAKQYFIHLVKF